MKIYFSSPNITNFKEIFILPFLFGVSVNNSVGSEDDFTVNNEIFIGEWCVLNKNTGINVDEENLDVLIGLVLGFSYYNGKTFKEREFSKVSAPVASDTNKGIGMLCARYTYDSLGKLTSVPGDKHEFVDIESYIGTISAPTYTAKVLSLSKNLIAKLRQNTDFH